MGSGYRDSWIECGAEAISVRGYYFPWGSRHIRYAAIRGVRRVELAPMHGKARIWGTANPRYWASLDPRRSTKKVGLILDLGGFVRPLLTPDDPAAMVAAIREHCGILATDGGLAPIL